MKSTIYCKMGAVILFLLLNISCEDFVEVEAPDNQLIREQVFSSDVTAKSAMQGIYNQLFQVSFSNGSRNSVTVLAGLSADNLENIYTSNLQRMEFQQNEILPENEDNLDLWSSAFNMIYMANSFLEGLEASQNLSPEVASQLEGETRFIRAFAYFYLTNIYGDVPLILTTNYKVNEVASRTPQAEVYEQIISDLSISRELLPVEYRDGERYYVNRLTSTALLARVHLYLQDWEIAESLSTEVINETSLYELMEDPNEVFKANSKEAIWQISPIGSGGIVTHTNEGGLFIIDPFFNFFASLQLTKDFIDEFQIEDKRRVNWTGYDEGLDAYFPTKYKIDYSTTFPIVEYSMVLRLAEQYLIRAETRVKQGNLNDAVTDINVIRNRAGLNPIPNNNSEVSQEELLNIIFTERRKELFTEWGHRWFDLKRNGKATTILRNDNQFWQDTDLLYPIPSEERQKNSNLEQNPGY